MDDGWELHRWRRNDPSQWPCDPSPDEEEWKQDNAMNDFRRIIHLFFQFSRKIISFSSCVVHSPQMVQCLTRLFPTLKYFSSSVIPKAYPANSAQIKKPPCEDFQETCFKA